MDNTHEPEEPDDLDSLEELENKVIGDLDDDISLDNLKQIEENGNVGQVHQLQSRVKTRIRQLLDDMDSDDRQEAWKLIHTLRNLAIARCNIEDQDPVRSLARLKDWAEEQTDEDGNLKDGVAEEIEERRDDLDMDDLVPHEDVIEQFKADEDDRKLSVDSYVELEEEHLVDEGRADLADFQRWLIIQYHAGVGALNPAVTLQKFKEAIRNEQ